MGRCQNCQEVRAGKVIRMTADGKCPDCGRLLNARLHMEKEHWHAKRAVKRLQARATGPTGTALNLKRMGSIKRGVCLKNKGNCLKCDLFIPGKGGSPELCGIVKAYEDIKLPPWTTIKTGHAFIRNGGSSLRLRRGPLEKENKMIRFTLREIDRIEGRKVRVTITLI